MSNHPDYTTPNGEPWETVASVADAFWLEPQDAAEGMRRLAERGFRVVPADQEDNDGR